MSSNNWHPKIGVIGAGFAGLGVGIQLKRQLGITDYVIFDENSEVGGTWNCNTYPGCACDVASHLYSYSYEPNPYWSKAYSSQPEIWNYLKHVANKYDLYKNIKLNHRVASCTWDEKIKKWRLMLNNLKTEQENEMVFDIIFTCVGPLRMPHTPEEFLNFQGPRIHTGAWDPTIELEGKTVAVVGSGASAVQLVTAICDKVKKMIVYQRHPAWVVPRLQFDIPEWMQSMFANVPGVRLLYRYLIFFSNELNYPAFKTGSLFHKWGNMLGKYHLKRQLGDTPEIMEKLTPNYEFGCKRITPTNDYYPVFKLPHVDVIRSPIVKVNPNSITTEDGKETPIDVLICATGYKVQDYFAPMEITVKNGINMLKLWKSAGPSTYMTTCCSVAPNLFFILGPNSGLGHNSVVFTIECQTNWALMVVKEMIERQSKVYQVKESAESQYMQDIMQKLDKMVWSTGCSPWYADHRGVVTALSPYSLFSFWNQTRTLNTEDLIFE